MSIGLLGKKCGMTRIFLDDGRSEPVTVVEVLPNRIVSARSIDKDGYVAYQVTTGEKKVSSLTKAEGGHFAKAGVSPGRGLWEVPVVGDDPGYTVGSEVSVEVFSVGQRVDVAARTIGKGYGGVVKRYNFRTQDATHGNSLSHRAPGSIGQNQTPGRVFKGKKMAGHMGAVRRTMQNLEVVGVRLGDNCLLVKGSVPGPKGGDVVVKPAVKR